MMLILTSFHCMCCYSEAAHVQLCWRSEWLSKRNNICIFIF